MLHRWREELEALAHRLEIHRIGYIKRAIRRVQADDKRFTLIDGRIDLHSDGWLTHLAHLI